MSQFSGQTSKIHLPSKSVFSVLKETSDNFEKHKTDLDDIKKKSLTIRNEFLNRYEKAHEQKSPDEKQKEIEEIYFNDMWFPDQPPIEYEERGDCSQEEEELIRKACTEFNIPIEDITNSVEMIKLSLGYKSNTEKELRFKKPLVAVVGQTKAGKSFLLNTMMQEMNAPQRQTRLTARITYFTYCDIRFVAYYRNKILFAITLGKSVDKADVDLDFDKRYQQKEVNIEVRVGCDNKILKNGFDIVDSPGLNENPQLNDLCIKMEKSLLPMIIYVIDGKNGLQETDVTDIKKIKDAAKDIQIIYFVTKLDRSENDMKRYRNKKMQKKIPLDQDLPGESEREVADRRLDNVFKKLRKSGHELLECKCETFKECSDFNGASLYYMSLVRVLNRDIAVEQQSIYEYNIQLMDKFEENLMSIMKEKIERPLNRDVLTIQTTLSQILERITVITSNYEEEIEEKRLCLEKFRKEEDLFYDEEKKFVQNELFNKIRAMIDEYDRELLGKVHNEEGVTDSRTFEELKNKNIRVYRRIIDCLRPESTKLNEKRLKQKLLSLMQEFMRDRDAHLSNKLVNLARKLKSKKFGMASFEKMLEERLFYEYQLRDDWSSQENIGQFFGNDRRKLKRTILESIKEISIPRKEDSQEEEPRGASAPSSYEAQGESPEIDRDKFLNNILNIVIEEVEQNHQEFQKRLKTEGLILTKKFEMESKEKAVLKEYARQLSFQYTRSVSVYTMMNIVHNPKIDEELLTTGYQAKIFKTFILYHKIPIVRKVYKKPFLPEKGLITEIGVEVYYSSRLNHERFLKLNGVTMNETPEGVIVSLYYPYLPMGSLETYLKRDYSRITIKERLRLATEISEGMRYLHKDMFLVHSNLNLKNILIREADNGALNESLQDDSKSVQAVIAGYGFMNSLGLMEDIQFCGTLDSQPTEVCNISLLKLYDPSKWIDVFSFGLTLWTLLTYRLNPEYDNYSPRFVIDNEHEIAKVKEAIYNGHRPERRSLTPHISELDDEELKSLMEKCWRKELEKRPPFYDTMKQITIDPDADDSMLNKNITVVMSELLERYR